MLVVEDKVLVVGDNEEDEGEDDSPPAEVVDLTRDDDMPLMPGAPRFWWCCCNCRHVCPQPHPASQVCQGGCGRNMCFGCHIVAPVCADCPLGDGAAMDEDEEGDQESEESEAEDADEDSDTAMDYYDVVQLAIDEGHALPSDPAAAIRAAQRIYFADDDDK
jgi:hypothetical protein